MRAILYIVSFFTGMCVFPSCEKVIDIELHATDPMVVVEGMISSSDSTALVNLSWSQDFYSTQGFDVIDKAQVGIINHLEEMYELTQITPGVYIKKELPITFNSEYRLWVIFGDKQYSASSQMPYKTPIDSVFYSYSTETLFADEGYRAWVIFRDPDTTGNCYRLHLYVDNERITDGIYYLWNDDESNGGLVTYIYYMNSLKNNVQFYVELLAIDRVTYEYLKSIQSIATISRGAQPAAPTNPENNISDEALGYFTATAVSRSKTLLIK